MGGELDLLVAPLGRAVDAGDETVAVHTPEVAVDEGMARLRFVCGTFRQAQMPLPVLVPGVGLEKGVFVRRGRLDVAPVAVEDVLAALDQPTGIRDRVLVDGVGGDDTLLRPLRGTACATGAEPSYPSASSLARRAV